MIHTFCWYDPNGINANDKKRFPIKKHRGLAQSLFQKGIEILTNGRVKLNRYI